MTNKQLEANVVVTNTIATTSTVTSSHATLGSVTSKGPQPLTYRCSSYSNVEIITPNCFLRPNVNERLVLKMDDQDVWKAEPPSKSGVTKSMEVRDAMLSKFNELWFQDYLLSLREQCRDLYEINFQLLSRLGQ